MLSFQVNEDLNPPASISKKGHPARHNFNKEVRWFMSFERPLWAMVYHETMVQRMERATPRDLNSYPVPHDWPVRVIR